MSLTVRLRIAVLVALAASFLVHLLLGWFYFTFSAADFVDEDRLKAANLATWEHAELEKLASDTTLGLTKAGTAIIKMTRSLSIVLAVNTLMLLWVLLQLGRKGAVDAQTTRR